MFFPYIKIPEKEYINKIKAMGAIIFFDVDGTLYKTVGKADINVKHLLEVFNSAFCTVFAWSGGGDKYAYQIIKQLGLTDYFLGYFSKIEPLPFEPDITIDDDDYTAKGKLNLKIIGSR